jgi:thiamine biosynthesis lipoprotein
MENAVSTFEGIGTQWTIRVNEPIEAGKWTALLTKIQRRIEVFDKDYSRFRSDSKVALMSEKAGRYHLPKDGYDMLRFYEQLYDATSGRVTPLIGQTLVDAGYDKDYTFQSKPLHRPPKWEDVLTYDKQSLTLTRPALLDFGAAGKGYLVDIVSAVIESDGVRSFLINAGGDILYRSTEQVAINVGLESPLDNTEAVGIAKLLNQSLCASAGSKRKWGEFHHIIDPTVLRSPEQVIATWVIADSTMVADGIATALFLTGAEALLSQFSFSYALLYRDMSLYYAKDFPVTTFNK